MARRPFSLPLPVDTRTRIDRLAATLAAQAEPQGLLAPSLGFVARAALEFGLDALERRHAAPAPRRGK